MSPTPRALTTDDLDNLEGLRPPDWAPFRDTYLRYFSRSFCFPFGLEAEGRLAATGTLIVFGASAWVGQVITAKAFQGRGLGTQMVQFLLSEATRRQVSTLSLVATDEGFPLYAKAGFRIEGEYHFWTRSAPAPAVPEASEGIDPLTAEGFASDLEALDTQATGESRSGWLGPLATPGWRVGTTSRCAGFFLPQAGEGLVVATGPRAGVPLLHRRIDGAERVVVPAENGHAGLVLEGRGFTLARTARRMVLGPSLVRRPDWVWSRIAGNLG